MASRRMFSKRVVDTARFLKMPSSTQNLYFHLGLNADDDGVVEAYMVLSKIGATEDDLKILVAKGFVQVLNEDLVSYITDWNENNQIRADRKIDSIYKELLLQIVPGIELKEKKPRADVKKKVVEEDGQPMDNQWTTSGQPMDGIGKDRVGKGSVGEDSVVKGSKGKGKKEPTVYYPTDELLNQAFADYVDMRKQIKSPMTERAVQLAMSNLAKLSGGDNDKAIRILEQSVMNSWKGLFALKEDKQSSNKPGGIDWDNV